MQLVQPTVSKTIRVYFDVLSDKISSAQMASLKKSLAPINKKKIKGVAITGYANRTSLQKKDDKLPLLRAKTVAIALKKLGINVKPVITAGGISSEKDWKARRVEIVLNIIN
jgi:outer membrane protein OmpA-like peptidoglycan-associated protein